jgi:hypothetical protein
VSEEGRGTEGSGRGTEGSGRGTEGSGRGRGKRGRESEREGKRVGEPLFEEVKCTRNKLFSPLLIIAGFSDWLA